MLCLSAGAVTIALALQTFTLAWTHSIEKIEWQEDWRVATDVLIIDEARIRGSGSGMEIPADAVLRDGAWHYRPAQNRLPRVTLAHSHATADWRLCTAGACQPLESLLPPEAGENPVTLFPCAAPSGPEAGPAPRR